MTLEELFLHGKTTNNITKKDADVFFSLLAEDTDRFIKANFNFYVKKGMWPLKAQVVGKGQKDPVFIVNHCTGAQNRAYKPAMHRFFQSEMASSNFLICDDGKILYLVDLKNQSYHATKHMSVPPIDEARRLKVNDGRFLNECGIEVVGSPGKVFSAAALESSIILQRFIVAYFEGSIKSLMSHRFFSPKDRPNDPSVLYCLPLINDSVFRDIDLEKSWLADYKKDAKTFLENSSEIILDYGLSDEWAPERRKIKITPEMLA